MHGHNTGIACDGNIGIDELLPLGVTAILDKTGFVSCQSIPRQVERIQLFRIPGMILHEPDTPKESV
ncbi:hypothetical protein [Halomonas sp. M20]|uniref:hypothetical protein n=1 Tax=Halomonas sp. M20 TaxID=2763264 RepID=UPI001D0A611D|nr:hypothetical protein [Halomonas sp. M20]